MTYEEKQELIRKIAALEWTEEIRIGHPWQGDLLVRKSDVVKAIEEMD